jgi:hypothetical protein
MSDPEFELLAEYVRFTGGREGGETRLVCMVLLGWRSSERRKGWAKDIGCGKS